jgi:hypothetical protein
MFRLVSFICMELSIVSRKAGKKTAGKRRDLKQSGNPGNMPQKKTSGRSGKMTLEKTSGRSGKRETERTTVSAAAPVRPPAPSI